MDEANYLASMSPWAQGQEPWGARGRLKRIQDFDNAIVPSMKSKNNFYLNFKISNLCLYVYFFPSPSSSNKMLHPQSYLRSAPSTSPVSISEDALPSRDRLWLKCLKQEEYLLSHSLRNLSFLSAKRLTVVLKELAVGMERMQFHLPARNIQLIL